MDGASGFEVVRPLPGSGNTLGFAVAAAVVASSSRFWLEVGGRSHALGTPRLITR